VKKPRETQPAKTIKKASDKAVVEPAFLRKTIVRAAAAPAAVDVVMAELLGSSKLQAKK
jgi:hypothetical protein